MGREEVSTTGSITFRLSKKLNAKIKVADLDDNISKKNRGDTPRL
jgi:hypothetical protein